MNISLYEYFIQLINTVNKWHRQTISHIHYSFRAKEAIIHKHSQAFHYSVNLDAPLIWLFTVFSEEIWSDDYIYFFYLYIFICFCLSLLLSSKEEKTEGWLITLVYAFQWSGFQVDHYRSACILGTCGLGTEVPWWLIWWTADDKTHFHIHCKF